MNTEKLEKLKKSLDNKFIPDNMKDKIRAEIKKLEADIKTDETITATEVKEEVKEIEKKVEKAIEVAEEKEEQAEAKAEEKKEKAPRKAREKKAAQSETKTPKVEPKSTAKKKSFFSIAKEIRKDNESWEDAKERARKMMKSETTETKSKVRTETQKLLASIRRKKELKGIVGQDLDLSRDNKRTALPRGKRISKNGKIYYEYRDNRSDRLAPNYKDKIYLAEGGGVDEIIELKPLELIPLSTQLNRLSGYNWTYGDWESEDGGKPSTIPNSVIVNVHTKQKFRLSPFYIYKGFDNYNNKPLYRVEDMSEEGEYVGEWHTNREDAKDELKGLSISYSKGGALTNERRHVNKSEDYEVRYAKDKPSRAGYKGKRSFDDGGSLTLTPETPLARGLDIDYTGLVGETGGMSAGEMFAEGGELKGKFLAEIKVPYNYESVVKKEFEFTEFLSKTLTKKWFGNGIWGVKIVKPLFEKDYSQKIVVEIEIPIGVTQGGGLDKFDVVEFISKTLTKKWFGNGVWGVDIVNNYAMGGSLGNHGLKQGDQILLTLSDGVQKIKSKEGEILYVDLSDGYRNVQPPLPFAKGGRLKSALARDRKYFNKSESWERQYSKDKPNRTGYLGKRSFDDGGQIEKSIRFTKNDYERLVRDSSEDYPFYSTKNGINQEIYKEKDEKKVAVWNSNKEILRITNDSDLIDWLERNSYNVRKYDDGGMIYKDLFEDYENQPAELSEIVSAYMEKFEEGDYDYEDSKKFLAEVESVGYTFDYGLDNEPYGLRPIGVELNQIEGYEEEYKKGGQMPTFKSNKHKND